MPAPDALAPVARLRGVRLQYGKVAALGDEAANALLLPRRKAPEAVPAEAAAERISR